MRAAPSAFPRASLMAQTIDDVVGGVQLARARGLQVALRSGGHSWGAWGLRDGVLLIDLSGLDELRLAGDRETALVGPGVRGGTDLSPFLASHGRMFPGGHCDTVGVSGFLLQGGQGWNSRVWGWACQSVQAIDVVTADGALVHASEHENSDLLWAARGAGPGYFAAVVRWHLRTYPAPRFPAMANYAYPLELFDEVLRLGARRPSAVRARLRAGDRERLGARPGDDRRGASPGRTLPVPARHRDGRQRGRGAARVRTARDMPRARPGVAAPVRGAHDPRRRVPGNGGDQPRGPPLRDRLHVDRRRRGRADPPHQTAVRRAADSGVLLDLVRLGPARVRPDMAFSVEGNVYLATYAAWQNAQDDTRCRDWVTDTYRGLEPIGKGVYTGDADFTRRPDRFLSDASFARLQELRRRYDPDGLFVSWLIAPGGSANVRFGDG